MQADFLKHRANILVLALHGLVRFADHNGNVLITVQLDQPVTPGGGCQHCKIISDHKVVLNVRPIFSVKGFRHFRRLNGHWLLYKGAHTTPPVSRCATATSSCLRDRKTGT